MISVTLLLFPGLGLALLGCKTVAELRLQDCTPFIMARLTTSVRAFAASHACASVIECMRTTVRVPRVVHFRDLNLGLAWSLHEDLK